MGERGGNWVWVRIKKLLTQGLLGESELIDFQGNSMGESFTVLAGYPLLKKICCLYRHAAFLRSTFNNRYLKVTFPLCSYAGSLSIKDDIKPRKNWAHFFQEKGFTKVLGTFEGYGLSCKVKKFNEEKWSDRRQHDRYR